MSPKKLEEVEEQRKEEPVQKEDSKPVKILTEKDAYLSEVMDSQPKTLAEIEVIPFEEKIGIHRLCLPEYFEQYSYDCTKPAEARCSHHGWVQEDVHFSLEHTMKRWRQTKFGKYVFRWFLNHKRATDEAKNLHGWFFVNRSLFPDAPRILFSINGSVEEGDNILGFMPAAKALNKRNKPSEISVSKIKSEAEKHPENPKASISFYEPKLSPEKKEGDDYAPPDAIQEGRDF